MIINQKYLKPKKDYDNFFMASYKLILSKLKVIILILIFIQMFANHFIKKMTMMMEKIN